MRSQFEQEITIACGVKLIPISDLFRGFCEGAAAISGLLFLSPVLLICAVLVRVSSPGKVFFKQRRVGRGGKIFTLYRFRTMKTANSGLPITAGGDSRITPVGKFLRKTKLDGLPQLFNILRGEMSFVGPRPEVVELVNLDDLQWQEVLSVRPGITDPVTLQLRNEESLLAEVENKAEFYREVIQPYKLSGYLQYIRSKSLAVDLKIIAQTFKAVLFPKTVLLTVDEIRSSTLSKNNFARR